MSNKNIKKEKKLVYRRGLLHHRYRFGLLRNLKVFICRTFGHQMNDNMEHEWCQRCGLCSTEIYLKQWQELFEKERQDINKAMQKDYSKTNQDWKMN
jgi:hypothetical protein